jgi:hypothetical protein
MFELRDELEEALENDRELETKTPSNSTMTRATKIKKAQSVLSTAAARRRNDPLYKKMIYYRELYYKYRALVHRRYGPGTNAQARR